MQDQGRSGVAENDGDQIVDTKRRVQDIMQEIEKTVGLDMLDKPPSAWGWRMLEVSDVGRRAGSGSRTSATSGRARPR